jgi:signal transduction histidine kinase
MMESLVLGIIDFSKIYAGAFKQVTKAFDIKEAVEEVASIVRYEADIKKIQLITEFEGFKKIAYQLISDCKRFKQVLLNLVQNSLKFTQYG